MKKLINVLYVNTAICIFFPVDIAPIIKIEYAYFTETSLALTCYNKIWFACHTGDSAGDVQNLHND